MNNTQTLDAIRAEGLNISQLITPFNYSKGEIERIKYIVVHYVGATGGAKANAQYYASQYIGASAHYYVGFDGEIVQSVEDHNIAWAVGTKNGYKHPICRNHNSVSIEMCVHNDNGSVSATDASAGWYFDQITIDNTKRLIKVLMEQYNVPFENVIRHHDVTGKICPAPYVNGQLSWDEFKQSLIQQPEEEEEMTQEKFNEMMTVYLTGIAKENPANWSAEARNWAEQTKLVQGDGNDNMMYHKFLTREEAVQLLYRFKDMI